MKTRQDNDVTNRISAVYVKKKKNQDIMCDQTKCDMWLKPDKTTMW